MSLGVWVLLAAAICLAIKLAGYLVPPKLLEEPRIAHTAGMVTVGLLAALVVIQTFGGAAADGALVLDARVVAIGVAAIALAFRAPFLVVVLLGAAAAALTRALGWG